MLPLTSSASTRMPSGTLPSAGKHAMRLKPSSKRGKGYKLVQIILYAYEICDSLDLYVKLFADVDLIHYVQFVLTIFSDF